MTIILEQKSLGESNYPNIEHLTLSDPTSQIPDNRLRGTTRVSSKIMEKLLAFNSSRRHSPTDYSLRLWDYGGHTEFLNTHDIFMSVNSTVLILLDVSRPLNQPVSSRMDIDTGVGIPNTPMQFFHYWLRRLHDQAIKNQTEPNVALILTHKDVIEVHDKEKHVDEYMASILNSIASQPFGNYIHKDNIFVIDNKTGDETEFYNLQCAIFKMITKQKSWGVERPTRWLQLEADIMRQAEKEGKYVLDFPVVKNLGKNLGIEDLELKSFLHFHNILGDFIFDPRPVLRNFLITDAQWLADTFKSLITPEEFWDKKTVNQDVKSQLKKAVVELKTLQEVWKGNPVEFLIELFQCFNLLLPGHMKDESVTTYIIPCMLPPIRRDMYNTEPFKSMVLTFNCFYSSASGGILPVGSFHKIMSDFSKKWNICSDDHLSYTDASFHLADGFRLALTLLTGSKIRSSIWCSKQAIDSDTIPHLLKIQYMVNEKLKGFGVSPDNTFLILCPFWSSVDDSPCLVRLKEDKNKAANEYTFRVQTSQCSMHAREVVADHFPHPWPYGKTSRTYF